MKSLGNIVIQENFAVFGRLLGGLITELIFPSLQRISSKKLSWRKGFSLLKEFDLSFDLQLYPEQMREAAEFLREHPQTPVVIDHAGSPYDQTEAGLKEWATGIKMLSQLDNTHVKISGFGMYNRDWNYQNTERIFQKLYETFGAKRMMWGSNFPVDRLMQSYGHCTFNSNNGLEIWR